VHEQFLAFSILSALLVNRSSLHVVPLMSSQLQIFFHNASVPTAEQKYLSSLPALRFVRHDILMGVAPSLWRHCAFRQLLPQRSRAN